MERLGVDYSWGRPSMAALSRAGVTFACRYLSRDDTGKNLTFDEAATLSAAGIAIVSNWEYDARAPLGGHAQGAQDAADADRQHRAAGGPPDRPIYFSVDFDASPAEQTAIKSGSTGQAVKIVQAELGAWGHPTGIDGTFGPDTDTKVRAFQRDHGLGVDGVVGPDTHAFLKTGEQL